MTSIYRIDDRVIEREAVERIADTANALDDLEEQEAPAAAGLIVAILQHLAEGLQHLSREQRSALEGIAEDQERYSADLAMGRV